MGARRFLLTLASGIFFLTTLFYVFGKPPVSCAQVSCSIQQIEGTCGVGNFACAPTATPTATPPPAPNPWIKLKVSNFSANSTNTFINFNIPPIVANREPFNTADTDENGDNSGKFMIGDGVVEPGVLTAPDITAITGSISQNDWKINKYAKKKILTPLKFLDYANARKDTIPMLTSTDPLTPNKINIIKMGDGTGTYIIDAVNAGLFQSGTDPATSLTGPTVLIIQGNLTIKRNINYKQVSGYTSDISGYTPTPLTIVVTGNTVINGEGPANEVNQLNAIFVLKNLTINATAVPEDNGLKIKGNLIVSGSFTNSRSRQNPKRPTLFIVTDPSMYTSLLPFLSTAQYEWKQIQ